MSGMKKILPKQIHQDFLDGLKRVISDYREEMTLMEMLVLSSQLVGMLISIQDRKEMTIDMVMELVMTNIQAGNQSAIENLTRELPTGQA